MKKLLMLAASLLCFAAMGIADDTDANKFSSANDHLLGKGSERWKMVIVHTNFGDIEFRLFDETPVHRDNFIRLAREGKFDNTLFFRVVNNFVIQGGDPETHPGTAPEEQGDHEIGYTLPAEINTAAHFHVKGCVGAAREGNDVNPEQRSSGCQFYFITGRKYDDKQLDDLRAKRNLPEFSPLQREMYRTLGGAPWLDGGYTVFGQVTMGMDVLDRIQHTPTDGSEHPTDPLVIVTSVEIK